MNVVYWVLCVLIGLLPAFFVYQKDRKKNIPIKWLPAFLRWLTFFLTAALLLAPAFSRQKNAEEKPLVVWLQDNSLSMNNALGKDSVKLRTGVDELFNSWKKDFDIIPLAFGTEVEKDSLFHFHQKSTDITNALNSVLEQYQDRNLGAIILASDGNFNEGLNPLYALKSGSGSIYTIGLGDSTKPLDALVSKLYGNKTVALSSTFELIADVQAIKLNGRQTEAILSHQGKEIAKLPLKINQDQFNTTLRFEVKANELGYQTYTVSIPALEGEENLQNNRRDFTVEVIENQTKVLMWAASPHPDIFAIKEALAENQGLKMTIHYGSEVPSDLQSYDLVIAHQIPATNNRSIEQLKNVPVWYILGNQSNLSSFSEMQDALKINGGGRPNVVLPIWNKNFSLFSTPKNLQEVIAKMPPIEVPSGDFQGLGGAQVLFQQQIGNVATTYPLWLFSSSTSRKAVLAGTGIWRWRVFEYKNFKSYQAVDDLIRQTVSFLSVKKDDRPFKVFMDKYVFNDNEILNIFAELRNENGELVNQPNATLVIKDSLGKSMNYNFEKGGNRYYFNLGLLAPGSYTFEGKINFNGKDLISNGSFKIASLPLEFLKSYSDFDVLFQLAQESQGKFYTLDNLLQLKEDLRKDKNMKSIIHTEKTSIHIIDLKWFFFLILLVVVAEWLLRKYWGL